MNEIQQFYDENSYKNWKVVLGEKMHYHTGVVGAGGDIFENTVKEISTLLEENSSVLDCGCGWGGPARYFIKNKNCDVTGVTISQKQYESISDFNVILDDMNHFIPSEFYDYAIFIESLTHMENPKQIIENLSSKVKNIIIKDYIRDESCPIGKNEEWNMHFRTKKDFYDIFVNTEYEIDFYKQTKPIESMNNLRLSAEQWLNNLNKLPSQFIFGQLELLKYHCYSILYGPQNTDINFVLLKASKK